MIHFTCIYCKKEITGITIVIDKTHFLHSHCELDFRKEKLAKLTDNWKRTNQSNETKKIDDYVI